MIKVYVNLKFRRNIHKYIVQINIVGGMALVNAFNFSAWILQLILL